ncbi:PREDICTED: WD repeat-containing protein 76 [Nelumbo nucifera]|uniref:WD repeat-containing protein 76 n=2 Tax=Nelumbo nucifera TaxID=4432 RepID=A0A1U8ARP2_NELNU|nr:PREDICTED: WD repeat-containing protein 76 [Nelumbo nucifera]DAD27339.1 TPA_asm: hypothetical protein HUJ06_028807 [Nelumbo nucifera]
MASKTLTEYERRRLENIKRNGEMMASLKLRSRAQQLSSAIKRDRAEKKVYKISPKKKLKTETPVVIRRSLRARGIPPDSKSAKGLEDDLVPSPKKTSKSPPELKPCRRTLGPISMRDAYSGISSDRHLIDIIMIMSENAPLGSSINRKTSPIKTEPSGDNGSQEAVGNSERPPLSRAVKEEVCPVKGEPTMNGSSHDSVTNVSENHMNGRKSCSIKTEPSDHNGSQEAVMGNSGSPPSSYSVKQEVCPVKGEPTINGSSHGSVTGVSENHSFGRLIKREPDEGGSFCHMTKGIAENVAFSCPTPIKKEKAEAGGCFNWVSLTLKPENIARVMPGRILNVLFFPTKDRTLIVAGNKFGNLAFWDADSEGEGDGIYLYSPHSGPISGILIQPYSLSKVFTSCYDGFIRLMDVEKESFDLVYSTKDAIFSLSQRPCDARSLYFGEGQGELHVWDERARKFSGSWILHGQRINSIDFNSQNTNSMATCSTDGTTCIWDLRCVGNDGPKNLKRFNHNRAVHSAYFSPSGSYLATTSINDTVAIFSGVDFENVSLIQHNNQTGRWLSSFRAIWGWDDSYLFIGNMNRGVDVISTIQRRITQTLVSPDMSAIPCRFAVHPYQVGALAGATSGGQVYMWTPS